MLGVVEMRLNAQVERMALPEANSAAESADSDFARKVAAKPGVDISDLQSGRQLGAA
jgi:hypothetical protein